LHADSQLCGQGETRGANFADESVAPDFAVHSRRRPPDNSAAPRRFRWKHLVQPDLRIGCTGSCLHEPSFARFWL